MKTIYDDGGEYDRLGIGQTSEETGFYAAQAFPGAKTLELACGTGRLTVPLAAQGLDITGLDNSPAMLAEAKTKAAQEGVSPVFVEADMRDFSLGKPFDLIFLPNNSLAHLTGFTDIEGCFACVRRHLSGRGRFVVDMFNPSLTLLMRDAERHYPVTEYIRPDGKTVTVTETVCYDAATQINHVQWYYQAGGEPAEVRSLEMRMFFPQELDALLKLNGFIIEAKYGGFDQSPFLSASRQQVIICH